MKKAFLIAMLLLFLLGVSFANEQRTLLSIDIANIAMSRVEVGFKENPISSRAIFTTVEDIVDGVSLQYDATKSSNTLIETLYIYWIARSANDFTVSLTGTPLVDDKGNTLNYVATWTPYSESNPVSIGEEGIFDQKIVYHHRPTLSLSASDSSELVIETEDLESVIPGYYRAELILIVEGE